MLRCSLRSPKLGPRRIHTVRVRGGNKKYRALRLDQSNFSLDSEAITRKTRIIAVVYNAVNNELVRTKTLVKNATIVIDASPQPIHTVRVHGGNKKYCAFWRMFDETEKIVVGVLIVLVRKIHELC